MIIPIGKNEDLKKLTLRLASLYYNKVETSTDVKGNPLFRLREDRDRVAVIVVTNQALLIPVETEVNALCKASKNF